MTAVPFDLVQDSVVIRGLVNGEPVSFILDTGDAVGPVFCSADADRLGLAQESAVQVSGAGGTSTSYTTTATVAFDDRTYVNEPCAIDPDLQGNSLLGLPFFIQKCQVLSFNFGTHQLGMEGDYEQAEPEESPAQEG